MQSAFSELFRFSKKERTGIFLLMGLITFIQVAALIIGSNNASVNSRPEIIPASLIMWEEIYDSLSDKADNQKDSKKVMPNSALAIRTENLFFFDPNTLSAEGWNKLGFPQKTIHSILRYREKGGRFRKPDDIRKIYMLPEAEANKLIPFVRIPETNKAERIAPGILKKNKIIININEADSAGFTSLPGIGPVLASRAVAYRKLLGGFNDAAQLKEVYGISDSLFDIIRPFLANGNCCTGHVKINVAEAAGLGRHPYIGKQRASMIVRYRQQHGSFRTPEDLLKIMNITPEFVERIRPYLDMEQPPAALR